jgi:hypothetical protein
MYADVDGNYWTPGQFKADFRPLPGYLEDYIPEFRFLFINLRKRGGVLIRLKSLNAALLLLKHIWSSKTILLLVACEELLDFIHC